MEEAWNWTSHLQGDNEDDVSYGGGLAWVEVEEEEDKKCGYENC